MQLAAVIGINGKKPSLVCADVPVAARKKFKELAADARNNKGPYEQILMFDHTARKAMRKPPFRMPEFAKPKAEKPEDGEAKKNKQQTPANAGEQE
jgi:hypothetical protein